MLTAVWVDDSYRITTSNQELNERLELAKSKFKSNIDPTITIPCITGKSGKALSWVKIVLHADSLSIGLYIYGIISSLTPIFDATIRYDEYTNGRLDMYIEAAKSKLFLGNDYTYRSTNYDITFTLPGSVYTDCVSLRILDREYCITTNVLLRVGNGSLRRHPRCCSDVVIKAYEEMRKRLIIHKHAVEELMGNVLRNYAIYSFTINNKNYDSYADLISNNLCRYIN
jgi:hypothetical protein